MMKNCKYFRIEEHFAICHSVTSTGVTLKVKLPLFDDHYNFERDRSYAMCQLDWGKNEVEKNLEESYLREMREQWR